MGILGQIGNAFSGWGGSSGSDDDDGGSSGAGNDSGGGGGSGYSGPYGSSPTTNDTDSGSTDSDDSPDPSGAGNDSGGGGGSGYPGPYGSFPTTNDTDSGSTDSDDSPDPSGAGNDTDDDNEYPRRRTDGDGDPITVEDMQPQRNIITGDAVDELDDAAQEFGGNTAINLNADSIVQLQDDQGNSKGVPNEKIGETTAMLTGASENQSGGGENTKGDEDPSGNNGDGSRDVTNNYIYRGQADTSTGLDSPPRGPDTSPGLDSPPRGPDTSPGLDSPPRGPGNSNRGGVLPPASSGGSVGGGSGGAPSGASGGGGLSTGTKAAAAAGTGAVGLGAAWYFGLL